MLTLEVEDNGRCCFLEFVLMTIVTSLESPVYPKFRSWFLFPLLIIGELLTTDEARRRQNIYDKLRCTQSFTSALLVIREHLPSGQACLRINIDATRIGNVARFINHSCDGGNLSTVLVRSAGALLPRLCFFAARDIIAEEELSFSYGDVRVIGKNRDNKLNCCCGSSCCFGTLPCENT